MFDFFQKIYDWLIESIKSFFQKIIDFFYSIFNFFSKIWDWIVAFILDFFNWLWQGLFTIYNSVTCAFSSWYDQLIGSVFDLFPNLKELFDTHYSKIEPLLSYFGEWIGLDTCFLMLSLYLSFVVVMITVKLIVKLFIPTVG